MNYFDWWPFEVLVLAQFGLGLALLLGTSFLKAPSRQIHGVSVVPKLSLRRGDMPKDAAEPQPERLAA
jgi:hypothetical protein